MKHKPNIVPAWEYVEVSYVPFKATKQYHTAAEFRRFNKWISGQTRFEDGCYLNDYARWVKAGMPDRQGKDFD